MNEPSVQWLEWLLGFDSGRIPAGAEVSLVWTYLPRSVGVFLFVGAVLAIGTLVAWGYLRENPVCPRWAKLTLAGLRLSVLLVLATVFLGPSLVYTTRRTLHPAVVLLRDDSQSMSTADRYQQDALARRVAQAAGREVESIRNQPLTRAALVDYLLEKDQGRLLAELQSRGKLQVMNFSQRLERVETRSAAPAPPQQQADQNAARPRATDNRTADPLPKLQAIGQGTDLYRALSDALEEKQAAAVVVWTDGQHTASGNLDEVAAEAKNKGVPLLIVGVGDPARPRNLSIAEVYADPQVWQDDPFEIQALLRAQGIGGRAVEVQLIGQQASDNDQPAVENVLERRKVDVPSGGGQIRLTFTHTPTKPGRHVFTVRVLRVENESNPDDNQPAAPLEVNVLSEQARVLLIAGAPSWEYRGVQRLLSREKSIDLSCWLQTIDDDRAQEGNTAIRMLPATREDLFAYDVIMLFDPDPKEFDKEWIDLVKAFLADHAGGVFYMAGPKYSGRFLAGRRTSTLSDLLPVRFGDVGAMEVATLLATNTRAWPLDVVAANVDQPLMRFYAEPEKSLSRWQTLPGIYWSFPTETAKPASRVLLEHSDPTLRRVEGSRPLLVAGYFGAGRTVYMGFGGTWRWRRIGRDAEFFNRFWIQAVRYLVEGRSLEGKRRGVVETEQTSYELGDRIEITARLNDAAYKPLIVDEVEATLRAGDRQPVRVVLRPVANQPGAYTASLVARHKGRHQLQVLLTDKQAAPTTITTTFAVTPPSVEARQVWLDRPTLLQLAELSGGRYFDVDQVDQLAAAIPDRRRSVEMQSKPHPLWATNRVLLLLVALLGVEWALRKRYKLI